MAIRLSYMSDDDLLALRFCDLPLRLEGTPLQRRVNRLYRELHEQGMKFRPRVWLSEEFFSPDGVAGFAIPFYLAHPRLMKLERKQMYELEGGTEKWCMRILRHEAGHALDNAYRLHSRDSWRRMFGSYGRAYPKSYKPKPNSRNFVLNLDAWYAQAHPAEDFAETFAVWLAPGGRWRTRYEGWPALRKLEYIDRLMASLADAHPATRRKGPVEDISDIRRTLKEHYQRKRKLYAIKYPPFYDRDLRRIFSQERKHASRPTAVAFLRQVRARIRNVVADGTAVHSYTIDQVLKGSIERARKLRLHLAFPASVTLEKLMVMLTAHTMNIVYSGHYRFRYGL